MQPRISIRLWQRLFLAFAVLSFAAIAGLTWLQQRRFETGLLDYVNRQQTEQIESAALRLARAYRVNGGSWDFLRRDRRQFRDLVIDDGRAPPDAPPPGSLAAPPPRGAGGGGGAPDGLMRRVVLLEPDGRHIVGNRSLVDGGGAPEAVGNLRAVAIRRDGTGTEVIGTLTHQLLPRLNSDVDIAFAQSQRRQALLAAGGLLLISLIAAVVLARWLLVPVESLGETARALAAGDYTARVPAAATGRGDELGALARDFNQAAASLAANQTARRRWTADIAHELRTPLTILQGDLQALREGVRVADNAALTSLGEECERLARVVEDLYQLAMSDSGALQYRFQHVDLRDVARSVVAAKQAAFSDAGLSLTLQTPATPAWVRADAQRLAQLVTNLLQNAMRYTDAPGRVEVLLRQRDGHVELQVDDSAPGVAAAHLPHLFERLYRADTSRARLPQRLRADPHGGAGLGLSICRSIADAHGAALAARASTLGGLQVVLTMTADNPT